MTSLPEASATCLFSITVWEWPSMKASKPVVWAMTSSLVQGEDEGSTPKWPKPMTTSARHFALSTAFCTAL